MKRILYLVVLMVLVSSCRAQCGAKKWRKSNKYYGEVSVNTNQTINLIS